MSGVALVLGGSGRFGRHAAEAFWNAGWRVRLFDRRRDDLSEAARGADVIVNGWNPPYTEWASTLPRITEAVIGAARASGATVIVPGNVYVYGANAPHRLTAETPFAATNPLGRLRIDMERAYRASGVRTILLRAGDFIDTEPSGNWFDKVIVAKLDKGLVTLPGPADAVHAWAYLPDLARAAVALAERRETLPPYAEVGYPGYALTLAQVADMIGRGTGIPVRTRPFPWWSMVPLLPVWPMGRKLWEMRYLWSMPHRIDRAAFDRLLPAFRHTDPVSALARAVAYKVHPDDTVPRGQAHVAAE